MFMTVFEHQQEPPFLEGSDDTIILPEGKTLLTDSQFGNFFNAPVSIEQDKTIMHIVLELTKYQPTLHLLPQDRMVSQLLRKQIFCATAVTAGLLLE